MADGQELILYAVRNQEGQWLRSKGYGGSGETWVDSLETARVYGRIGPARARVSYFANNHPDYGIPEIVALVIGECRVLDETGRVEKVTSAKMRRRARQAVHQAKTARRHAESDLAHALERLTELDSEAKDGDDKKAT